MTSNNFYPTINTIINTGTQLASQLTTAEQEMTAAVKKAMTEKANEEVKTAMSYGRPFDQDYTYDEIVSSLAQKSATGQDPHLYVFGFRDNKHTCDVSAELLAKLKANGYSITQAETEDVIDELHPDLEKKYKCGCFNLGSLDIENLKISFTGVSAKMI